MKQIEHGLKVGDIIKKSISKFGREGDPIVEYKKFIIFIKGSEKLEFQLNNLIEFKITKILPKFAVAEIYNGK